MIKAFVYLPNKGLGLSYWKQLAETVLTAKTTEGIYRIARNLYGKNPSASYRLEFHHQHDCYGTPFKVSCITPETNYRGEKCPTRN